MRSLGTALLLILLPVIVWAQSGRIDGVVKERYKARPIKGVQVKLIPSNRTAVTDSTGRFCVGHLQPGEYSVIITKIGYLQNVIPAVKVLADSAAHLQVELDKVPPPVKDKIRSVKQRIRPRKKILKFKK